MWEGGLRGSWSSGFIFLYESCAAGLRGLWGQSMNVQGVSGRERPSAQVHSAACNFFSQPEFGGRPAFGGSLRSGGGQNVRSVTCLHSAHSHSSPREGGVSIKWCLAPLRLRLPGAVECTGPWLPREGSGRWWRPGGVTQR